jgi:NADH dehydrogenase (ubiquinone) Fe-S protein 1
MLRFPLHRVLNPPSPRVVTACNRGTTTKAPEKVEVFIDEKRVLVDPGTTVLQVGFISVTVSPGGHCMQQTVALGRCCALENSSEL